MRPRSRASSPSRRAEILDRFVERPRHRPELVVAEVERRGRQVAAAVALRHFGDRAHAPAEPARHEVGDAAGAGEGEASATSVAVEDGPELLADVGERQRQAHERDVAGRHRDRDVQHVDAERGAVASRAADPGRLRA